MKTLTNNKKARYEYVLNEKYEAGISLQGWEVKSIIKKKANLAGAYVILRDGEAFLLNCEIIKEPTSQMSTLELKPDNSDQSRSRKLLLNRQELNRLLGLVEQKGCTLIPTKLYLKDNKIKLEFHVAKGKDLHDKRETIKDREWKKTENTLLKNKVRMKI